MGMGHFFFQLRKKANKPSKAPKAPKIPENSKKIENFQKIIEVKKFESGLQVRARRMRVGNE
jgi:hypothetical protein